ncbi:MAG: type II secretion system protein [Sulfuricellaceae bacterium]|nr:type II secretion system protein [Sulfuricellaceae bacterium]
MKHRLAMPVSLSPNSLPEGERDVGSLREFHANQAIDRQSGISLVEVIIFIVVVGIGVTGLMSVMNSTTKYSADPMIRKQAIAVGESLLEEIMLHPFTYCDPDDPSAPTAANSAGCTTAEGLGVEGAETRYSNATPFDNVNDYSGFSMAAGIYPVNDGATLVAGLGGYKASVAMTSSNATAFGFPSDADAVLRIDVTVTDANGNDVTLTGYRFRYAPNATL